jgi:hypothetical protein
MSQLFDRTGGEWNHTNHDMDRRLGDINTTEKIFLSHVLFLYTQKNFKNAMLLSVSPKHSAQDAPHSPFTHTLLYRDTARRSACTCFVHICPFAELLMSCHVVVVRKRGRITYS